MGVSSFTEMMELNREYWELSGYKPLSERFVPDWFRPAIKAYDKNGGKYTTAPYGSKAYMDFWGEELRRCREGYKIRTFFCPGDLYYWLNYYKLPVPRVDGSGREIGPPQFWEAHYVFSHIVEWARKLKKNLVVLKPRGVGWSEYVASMAANLYTHTPQSVTMFTASNEDYLDGIMGKWHGSLDWNNANTQRGLKLLSQAKNTKHERRASMKDKEGIEFGHMSKGIGIIADKPGKVRGARTNLLIFEEFGSYKESIKTLMTSRDLMEVGGIKFGIAVCFGCVCAGTKVWTNSGKLVSIEDLRQTEGILGHSGRGVSKEPITYMQPPSEKPCYRITTHTGRTLECSEDHPVYAITGYKYPKRERAKKYRKQGFGRAPGKAVFHYGFKRTDELKIKDRVAVIDSVPVFGTKQMWEPRLVGWLIGDGTYGFDKTPVLSNCDHEINSYIENRFDTETETEYITEDGKCYKETRIKGICHELRNIGIYGQTKDKKRLPGDIHSYSKETICELLGGILDTDGYVQLRDNKVRVNITLSVLGLCEELLLLFQKLGIHGNIQPIKPSKRERRIKDTRVYYRLLIDDTLSIQRLQEEISLFPKEKQTRLDFILEGNQASEISESHLEKGIRMERVINIEYIGIKPIYNLTAGNSHTYIANGIVTHNTGGDEGSNGRLIEGLMHAMSRPKLYDMLPLKHRFTPDGSVRESGLFFPSYVCMMKYNNRQGVTDIEQAYNECVNIREAYKAEGAIKEHQDYAAEKPFYIEEAFAKSGTNPFNALKLANQELRLTTLQGNYPKPQRGELQWRYKEGTSQITGVEWTECPNGRIELLEKPELDSTGKPYKNLYIGGIDGIDMGSDNSLVGSAGSKFACVVKKRFLSPEKTGNIYVAKYVERPPDERDAFEIALKLAIWFGCKFNVERTRKEVISYFRQHKMLRYMAKAPTISTENVDPKKANNIYGTPVNEKIILHGIGKVKEYVDDFSEAIFFLDMIKELREYAYERKGRFDIVAAMQMCELLDEDYDASALFAKSNKPQSTDLEEWGYYTDPVTGYKKFGPIPTGAGRPVDEQYQRLGFETPEELYTEHGEPGKEHSEEGGFDWVDPEESGGVVNPNNKLHFSLGAA